MLVFYQMWYRVCFVYQTGEVVSRLLVFMGPQLNNVQYPLFILCYCQRQLFAALRTSLSGCTESCFLSWLQLVFGMSCGVCRTQFLSKSKYLQRRSFFNYKMLTFSYLSCPQPFQLCKLPVCYPPTSMEWAGIKH